MEKLCTSEHRHRIRQAMQDDAVGACPSLSSSTRCMCAQPNSYRRGTANDEPSQSLSRDSREKKQECKQDQNARCPIPINVNNRCALKLNDLSVTHRPMQGPEQDHPNTHQLRIRFTGPHLAPPHLRASEAPASGWALHLRLATSESFRSTF